MSNFEVTIGIEIHIELNTKSKMFSPSPIDFNAAPNTNLAPFDVGYPGAMPSVNAAAVHKALILAKALKMEIDHELHFDRKHYFYPDLPKGFQITQQFRPIGKNGQLPLPLLNQTIAVERIHLEEDTARSYHRDQSTWLDFNRAGIPLVEIVTEPVIHTKDAAVAYVEMIRQLAKTLAISDAKMEHGSLRADINISLRPPGQQTLGTKVEIKNLNSLANIAKGIDYEIAAQSKTLAQGQDVLQATKRFDEKTQTLIVMRSKVTTADYRYFPEPNLVPIALDQKLINAIVLPELPWAVLARLKQQQVDEEYVIQLMQDHAKLTHFDQIKFADKKRVAKLFFAEIIPLVKKQGGWANIKFDPVAITTILEKQASGDISGKQIKTVMTLLLEKGQTLATIFARGEMAQISDEKTLQAIVTNTIADHQEFITKNQERPERVMKFIIGQIMKATRGQANPVLCTKLVKTALGVN